MIHHARRVGRSAPGCALARVLAAALRSQRLIASQGA
jgi:hypothetical protein